MRIPLSRMRNLEVHLEGAIEKREELVELLLTDRVVFVVVAAGATYRQTQPYGAQRIGAIHDLLDSKLLLVDTALSIRQRVAAKSGSYFLVHVSIRQEISSQLLDRK